MPTSSAFFLIKYLSRVCVCVRACVSSDRVSCVWQTVRDHLYQLCVHANESCFLVERAVVGLLRLAIRLLRREEISSQVQHKHSRAQSAHTIHLECTALCAVFM